jgi:hypothetical protein
MKLAYSDLRRYNADPRTYDVPVAASMRGPLRVN